MTTSLNPFLIITIGVLLFLQILDNLSLFFSLLIFVKSIKLAKKTKFKWLFEFFWGDKKCDPIRFQSFFIVKIYNMLITTILLMPKTFDITLLINLVSLNPKKYTHLIIFVPIIKDLKFFF